MTSLVLLDYDVGGIRPSSRAAVAAALILGETHVLVVGAGIAAAAKAAAALPGVAKVIVADAPAYAHTLAEPLAALMQSLAPAYTHLMAAASSLGKNVMPRLAALIDSQPIGDVLAVIDAETFTRPIYAGNALATVRSGDAIKVLTIRATAFDPVGSEGGAAVIATADTVEIVAAARFLSAEASSKERPDLTSARVVVSGGRGMGSAEAFRLLDPIADRLGAAMGASRAAVDAGFMPSDTQVGQTGKIVAPELYLAVGISGAIQHLAGMKDSKVIVAINKDEEAPIFQVADYGLVADLFQALPALDAALAAEA